ncbi:MAG: phosphoenolpyruvate synthase [Chloroflexota bacterium]
MTHLTLPFTQISAADLPKVGGKGANLGELTQAGFKVPPGFCVTTDAFAQFMAAASADIYTQLEQLSSDNLEELRLVGNAVRAALVEVPLPLEVETTVTDAWSELGESHAYAVRSSATAEDLPHASFAGQQDTYLNVRGRDALLENVKACFISLFTDRAILYRAQNGFDHRQVALSVVVQQMVHPDVAGILFTADPVTGNRHIASIDASFGLGEALVSGLVSADLYQVDKRTKQIIKRQIATKQIAIRSLAVGGTEQVELAEGERTQAALTDPQTLELVKLGSQIEAHYGRPQDIEWALVDDVLYITQSRPITSLYPLPEPKPDDDALHAYFSMSHLQVMTDAMPPLAMSILRMFVPVGRPEGEMESQYIHTAGGRFYANVSPLLRHPLGRRILLRIFGSMDELAANALSELAQRPDFLTNGERFNPLSILPAARPHLFKAVRMLVGGQPEGIAEEATQFIEDHVVALKAKLNAAPDLRTKLEITTTDIQQLITPILTWLPYMGVGAIATGMLGKIVGQTGNADDLAAIGRGVTGNVVTDMNLAVGDLADAARLSDSLATHLSRTDIDAQTRLQTATEHAGGAAFTQAWQKFIDRYGARGPSEIDISRPRWSEDPTSLLQMVVNVMRHSEPGAHRVHYQQLMDEGEAATERLTAAARSSLLRWLRRPLIRRLIRVSRNLSPLREHHKFFVIQVFALFKSVLLEAGEQMVREERLKTVEDIWFLTMPEVLSALDNPALELHQLVPERRMEMEHYQQLTPPRVMTSDGEIPVVKLAGTDAPDGALIGSPVSAGVVEGIARVVLDPSTEALEPGEILVAPFTDPGWTPLFVNAGGLITEVGGLMTHGSVVAREYGIPAVVGVIEATKAIKTGDHLRVHGGAGYVEFVNGKDSPEEVASV